MYETFVSRVKKGRKNFDITYLSCKPREPDWKKFTILKMYFNFMNFTTLDFFTYR